MSTIDRQRITAVTTLERLGFSFNGIGWKESPSHVEPTGLPTIAQADALHALLVQRADTLSGCAEGSAEADELDTIADAVMAYEAIRWPEGRVKGGKG